MKENFFNVIVMGQGPAGLTTALYTQRANISTLVIGKNDGSLKNATIENFFGISEKISISRKHCQ